MNSLAALPTIRQCDSCRTLGHICRVCLLIQDFRAKQQAKQLADNVVPIRRSLFDIPLKAVERTKPERYTIGCERCGKRCNPNVDVIVGAICEGCWLPQERPTMQQSYELWTRRRVPQLQNKGETVTAKKTSEPKPTSQDLLADAELWLRRNSRYSVRKQDGYDLATLTAYARDPSGNKAQLQFSYKLDLTDEEKRKAAIISSAAKLAAFLEEFNAKL